jgi:hypothetical protein
MAYIPDVNELMTKALNTQKIILDDFSKKIHALKYNYPLYARPGSVIGIVMHNTSGMVTLANLVGTWKNKEPNPPPSHLAIDQTGRVGRYVLLQYADRATERTNRHISIEFQAVENGDITEEQIRSAAVIMGFCHVVYGVELKIAASRTEKGLAHHSLFVDKTDPKAHANCPGKAILARKAEILEQAKVFASKMGFADEPAGTWQVKVDRWVWIYTFDANGTVVWVDPFNKKTGKGSWRINAGEMSISWANSTTKETWDLSTQTGKCTMDKKTYDLQAVRV